MLVSVVTRHGVGDMDRNIHIAMTYVEEGRGGGEDGEEKEREEGERRRGGGEVGSFTHTAVCLLASTWVTRR